MSLSSIFSRRLYLGVALLALLAIAGSATTLAATQSRAASNDQACAQDTVDDNEQPGAPDTDNIQDECGDQHEDGETNDDNGTVDQHEDGETNDDLPGQVSPQN